MSTEESLTFSKRLRDGLRLSTLKMLERKLRLGEPVVTADSDGKPLVISAAEALRIFMERTSQ